MDKKTLMEALARQAFERGSFNGTWLYAEGGEIITRGALGWLDPENTRPMREDSVFYLASVTKQFTAAAVMLTRRGGLLALEDEITKFYPEIPYKGVTIRHLLNHTGGLPDYFPWVDKLAKAEHRIPGNEIILRFLRECGQEPLFAPGEKFSYSNTGYCLLAQIVETCAGIPYEEFLRRNLFEPAGMTATRLYHRRKDGITINNFAVPLFAEFGSGSWVLPDDSPMADFAVTTEGMSGDGEVHSNVLDLFRWDRALREETVLTKEEQALMYTPGRLNSGENAADTNGALYGFGWYIRNDPELGRVVFHGGGMPGVNTWFERFLDADRVLIRLCSRDALDTGVYAALWDGMNALVRDREPEPIRSVEERAVAEPDRSGWDAFCGRYEYPEDAYFRIDEIFRRDGELLARAAIHEFNFEKSCELKLWPLGENRFFIKDAGELCFEDGCVKHWGETHKKLQKRNAE